MYVRFDESFLQVQDSHPNVLKHQLSPSPDNGEKTTNTDRSRMVQTIQEFTPLPGQEAQVGNAISCKCQDISKKFSHFF